MTVQPTLLEATLTGSTCGGSAIDSVTNLVLIGSTSSGFPTDVASNGTHTDQTSNGAAIDSVPTVILTGLRADVVLTDSMTNRTATGTTTCRPHPFRGFTA